MIERMEHRGGWSCDNDTGDGAPLPLGGVYYQDVCHWVFITEGTVSVS